MFISYYQSRTHFFAQVVKMYQNKYNLNLDDHQNQSTRIIIDFFFNYELFLIYSMYIN